MRNEIKTFTYNAGNGNLMWAAKAPKVIGIYGTGLTKVQAIKDLNRNLKIRLNAVNKTSSVL